MILGTHTCASARRVQLFACLEPAYRWPRGMNPTKIMAINTPDLAKQPPRSPRVRLGGYVILPRMLDKGRAQLAGKIGEYKYACPLDEEFLDFAGVHAQAMKKQLATGKGDGDILKWIEAHGKHRRTESEIETWSAWQERRAPGNPDSRDYFNELHKNVAPKRTDLISWFDLLDVDDFASFGGRV